MSSTFLVWFLVCIASTYTIHANNTHQQGTNNSKNHHAVPLLTRNGTFYEFHKDNLERIIQQNGVGHLPVSIVSITGKLRQGKSFFLNYILRYLQSTNKGDWLGDENQPLEGFKWTRSSKGLTKGILIWSEIFKTRDSNGNEIAIMLMDTQGTFDQNSSERDNLIIFGLSTLISSLQIFNIKDQIDESSLQNLAHFSEYTRLAGKESKSSFQTLLFLIRDWCNDHEFAFGETGSQNYINSKFNSISNLNSDARKVRESIKKAYNKLSCSLLPHPGLDATRSHFKGSKAEVDKLFLKSLGSLIPSTFGSGKLSVKKINGKSITCNDVVDYIDSYSQVYNSDALPEPTMLFEAIMKTTCDKEIKLVVDVYEKGMQKEMELEKNKPYMYEEDFDAMHKIHETFVLDTYTTAIESYSISDAIVNEKYRELEDKLDEKMKIFRDINGKNRQHRNEKIKIAGTAIVGTSIALTVGKPALEKIAEIGANIIAEIGANKIAGANKIVEVGANDFSYLSPHLRNKFSQYLSPRIECIDFTKVGSSALIETAAAGASEISLRSVLESIKRLNPNGIDSMMRVTKLALEYYFKGSL